jgi:hypothetical protein
LNSCRGHGRLDPAVPRQALKIYFGRALSFMTAAVQSKPGGTRPKAPLP